MPLISKTFPSPYGGISEQSVELMLDQQCIDMVNCVPDVVLGLQRRNGTSYTAKGYTGIANKTFHFYDRGEGDERYFFILTGNAGAPLQVFDYLGVSKTVAFSNASTIFTYLDSTKDNLKSLTVQDRTFITNTTKTVGQTTVASGDVNYGKVAYYWLKRSSNDVNNEYRYTVYINGTAYSTTDKTSDTAASELATLINAVAGLQCSVSGSILKIYKDDLSDFTFAYSDSWGDQASFGWKGSVAKLSDLPNKMGVFSNTYAHITGDDNSSFTDYYVVYDGETWVETKSPLDTRGTFTNMPIYVDRLSNGTFYVGTLSWEEPHVGNSDNNTTPSFVNGTISNIFFYKNRLGFASGDKVILSETGGYYNFYSKTILEVLDDDPIDITIPSNDASRVYYAVPFQAGLFVFTKNAQYILKNTGGTFSPLTVTFDIISRIQIDTTVEPIHADNSLFFVSLVGTKSQLREYKYNNDSLVADGIDLSLQVPTLLPGIKKMVLDSSLGFVIMQPDNDLRTLYLYRYVSQGDERVQSSFFKWTFGFDINNIFINRNLLMIFKTAVVNDYLLTLDLVTNNNTKLDRVDEAVLNTMSYPSYFVLPRWNIKVTKMETPVDTIIMKRLTFIGEGTYNVDIYRKDYGTTTSRTYSSNSTIDGSASVLAKNKNVVITLKNNGDENFRLDSMILDGLYTQTTRETN